MQRTMPREPRRRERSAPCCTSSAVNASARVAAVVTFCLSPAARHRRCLRARDLLPTDRGPLGAGLPCLGRGERRTDGLDAVDTALLAHERVDEDVGVEVAEGIDGRVTELQDRTALDDGLVGRRAAWTECQRAAWCHCGASVS